jgi:hypothetical protein
MKFPVVITLLLVLCTLSANAQRRAGGGAARTGSAPQVNRSAANTSIRSNQDVNRSANLNRDVDVNRNTSTNRNVDVNRNANINRNVDVDRDIDVNRDVNVNTDYDRWGHPVARGAAFGAAAGITAAATSAALGSTVAVLPPSCTTIVVDGTGYSQCGSTWYQPYYAGTTVQYTVVSPPQ